MYFYSIAYVGATFTSGLYIASTYSILQKYIIRVYMCAHSFHTLFGKCLHMQLSNIKQQTMQFLTMDMQNNYVYCLSIMCSLWSRLLHCCPWTRSDLLRQRNILSRDVGVRRFPKHTHLFSVFQYAMCCFRKPPHSGTDKPHWFVRHGHYLVWYLLAISVLCSRRQEGKASVVKTILQQHDSMCGIEFACPQRKVLRRTTTIHLQSYKCASCNRNVGDVIFKALEITSLAKAIECSGDYAKVWCGKKKSLW